MSDFIDNPDDQMDPMDYAMSTGDIDSIMQEYGFKYEGQSTLGGRRHWTKQLKHGIVLSVIDDPEHNNVNFRKLKRNRGSGDSFPYTVMRGSNTCSNPVDVRSILSKMQESVEDDDDIDPIEYAVDTVSVDSILKSCGFVKGDGEMVFSANYPPLNQEWTDWWTASTARGKTCNAQVYANSGNVYVSLYSRNGAHQSTACFPPHAYGNMRGYLQRLTKTGKVAESGEDDDLDPKAYINQTLDPSAVLKEFGFKQVAPAFRTMEVPEGSNPKLWERKKGTKLERVSYCDDVECNRLSTIRYNRYRLYPKNPHNPGSWIEGSYIYGVRKLRAILSSLTEGEELVHRLLDADPDAFEPKGELDRYLPNRCPNCGSGELSDADAKTGERGCYVCGIDFNPVRPDAWDADPDRLLGPQGFRIKESDEDDIDPSSYVSDLPDRKQALKSLVNNKRCTQAQAVEYAIMCAEEVLFIWEEAHPKDDRPRKAIEAAREWLAEPTEARREAADSAAADAYYAAAAAAHAAAYYAAAAASATSSVDYCWCARRAELWADKALKNYKKCKNIREEQEDDPDDPKNAMPSILDRIEPPRISISFSKITPESSANGDCSETGWEDEEGVSVEAWDDQSTVDCAFSFLRDEGAVHASSSNFHKGVWYSTEWQYVDIHTGEQMERCFHLKGFTEQEELELFNRFKERKIWR